jgi:hypothetical protein
MFLQHWVDKTVAAVLKDSHARTWLKPDVQLATLRPAVGQYIASKQYQQWQEQQQQGLGQQQQQQWSAQPACLLDVLLAELELLVNPQGLTAGAPEVDYRWVGCPAGSVCSSSCSPRRCSVMAGRQMLLLFDRQALLLYAVGSGCLATWLAAPTCSGSCPKL